MSQASARFRIAVAATGIAIATWGGMSWWFDPSTSTADPPSAAPPLTPHETGPQGSPLPSDPAVSIVFVIDGNAVMHGAKGPTYFDMAKEGISQLLTHPEFPLDGEFELAVIQNTQRHTPPSSATVSTSGYIENVHWVAPVRITQQNRAFISTCIARLWHSGHHSATLIESGLSEALKLFQEAEGSAAGPSTSRHIVLLSNGSYLLGRGNAAYTNACPPEDYVLTPLHGEADGCSYLSGPEGKCNRSRQIRSIAKAIHQEGISLSVLQMGPDAFQNLSQPYCELGEAEHITCNELPTNPSDAEELAFGMPMFSDLLKQITYSAPCTSDPVGHFARVNPYYCFFCNIADFMPGSPEQVSQEIRSWLCQAAFTTVIVDATPIQQYDADFDQDGILDLCDNCPDAPNSQQEDCNKNGQGDRCESGCDISFPDSDNDGVCDTNDDCPVGDDCYAYSLTSEESCSPSDICACDCDHDGQGDPCQIAQDLAANMHDPDTYCDGVDEQTTPECFAPEACRYNLSTDGLEDFDSFDWAAKGWLACCEDGGATCSRESVNALCFTQNSALVLQSADTEATRLHVEGPGLRLPWWDCHIPSFCGTPFPTGWAITAIELTMSIQFTNAETEFELFVNEPCEADEQDRRRAVLKFVKGENNDVLVYVLQGPYAYCPDEFEHQSETSFCLWEGAIFSQGTEFTLRLAFDDTRNYGLSFTQDSCEWMPSQQAVKLSTPGLDTYAAELGHLKPFSNRGVQLAFHVVTGSCTPDCSGDSWTINAIRIHPIDKCELQYRSEPNTCGSGECNNNSDDCIPPGHDRICICHWVPGGNMVWDYAVCPTNNCCTSSDACGPSGTAGTCCSFECCQEVCGRDGSCCNQCQGIDGTEAAWDEGCRVQAWEYCSDACDGSIPADVGPCCFSTGLITPGCIHEDCRWEVCEGAGNRPECCTTAWDQSCVNTAIEVCSAEGECGGLCGCYPSCGSYEPSGENRDCCLIHAHGGCVRAECCNRICDILPQCCTSDDNPNTQEIDGGWSQECVNMAQAIGCCGYPGPG